MRLFFPSFLATGALLFYSGRTKSYLRKLSELHYILNSPDLSPYHFLFCNPLQAEEHVSWGQAEVGYENMLAAEDLQGNFGWNYSEFLLQTVLNSLKSMKSMTSSFINYFLKMR